MTKLNCPNCKLSAMFCYCTKLKLLKLKKTHVTIIRSYKERTISTNTARLAQNCIRPLDLYDRGFIDGELNDEILKEDFQPVYLYPDESSVDIFNFKNSSKPIQLIVPDGSWRQTKKIKRREPWLNNVPSVFIPGDYLSKFIVRKQKQLGYICTIEAINYALNALEDNFDLSLIEYNLNLLVDTHVKFRPRQLEYHLKN